MASTSPGLTTGFNLSVITDKAAQIFVIFVINKFNFVGAKGANTGTATIPTLPSIHIHHIIIGWTPATSPVSLPTPTTTIIITHVLSPVIVIGFTIDDFRPVVSLPNHLRLATPGQNHPKPKIFFVKTTPT
jgi:hypothetical protein